MKRALIFILLVGAACPASDDNNGADGGGTPATGDGSPAGVCSSDQDCRLFDDYCQSCNCRALPTSQPDPVCTSQAVSCLSQPCARQMAVCRGGTCVPAPTAGLRWYLGCGDPVCRGFTPKGDVPDCASEQAGATCTTAGLRCDPHDDCNRVLVCASSDPTTGPGGCPRSRRESKRDIHYLTPSERRRYEDDLLRLRLATWRYKQDPERPRLGFIIDDLDAATGQVAVAGGGETVDLYGYASLAVATLQAQAEEIAELRRQVAALQRAVAARAAPASRHHR